MNTPTILVVEDDATLRSVLVELLEEMGYGALSAADAAEALEVSRRHAGRLALLLTDLMLPGARGDELAQKLRGERPGLKVLFVSGYAASTAVAEANLPEHELTSLQKPFSSGELASKVESLLGVRPGA